MECKAKMEKEYGTDYWKPCSQQEFFGSMLSQMRDRREDTENWSGLKEQFRQIAGKKEKIYDWIKCDDCDHDKRILCPRHDTIFEDLAEN